MSIIIYIGWYLLFWLAFGFTGYFCIANLFISFTLTMVTMALVDICLARLEDRRNAKS